MERLCYTSCMAIVEKKRTFVVVRLSTVQKARRDKLNGIYRYARRHGWDVQVAEDHPFAPKFANIVKARAPDGLILDGDAALDSVRQLLPTGVPIVYLDCPALSNDTINHDNTETAHLAARSLLRLNLVHYAYVGTNPGVDWSCRRGAAFADTIVVGGGTCSVYDIASTRRVRGDATRLRAWLVALPKPCGVFAAMDLRAKDVMNACASAGIKVPDDIALLGVDDDEPLCESTYPSLSSVAPDFQRGGMLAAELLDAKMWGQTTDAIPRLYGPQRIVVRESMRRYPVRTCAVSDAVEFIRRNACSGIRVEDVIPIMKVSRRTAEMSFRHATGHSILNEIECVRLDAVQTMLRANTHPINFIAQACGYNSDAYLKNLFKKRFGLSMRAWRTLRGAEGDAERDRHHGGRSFR